MRYLVTSCTTACCLLALVACRPKVDQAAGPQPVQKIYNKKTGRLERLDYDTKKSGRVDTRCYMDGTRLLRIEIDRDGDGKIDRWEYYGADQKLEKVGISRQNDGIVDAWAYSAPDGTMARLEISTARDGKVTRTEYYEGGALVRAEEDTHAGGRPDKWETYKNGALESVAFDTTRRGTPDRRLTYLPNGKVVTEKLK
jgi:antitoxin component YwqK of YwqJK toxin-antitoxin module